MEDQPVPIYISSAEADAEFKNGFVRSLQRLVRSGRVEILSEQEPDFNVSKTLQAVDQIYESKVLFFLVTPTFIAEKYYDHPEVRQALKRHSKGEMVVLPIMVEPTNIHDLEMAKFFILPKNAKPISKWPNQYAGWENVVEAIRPLLEKLSQKEAGKGVGETTEGMRGRGATVTGPRGNTEREVYRGASYVEPNEDFSREFDTIVEVLERGNLKEGLEALLKFTKTHHRRRTKDVVLLLGRFNGVQREYDGGIISHGSKSVSETRIFNSTMNLIGDLQNL